MAGPGAALIGQAELDELEDVIWSKQLGRYGPETEFPGKVHAFEQTMAERVGTSHALAVNSGTSALWLLMQSLDLREGDEVIVPGFTYVATMSAVTFAGGIPVLAEVDETFNLDPLDVERRITPLTRAIVAVHMLGSAARMDELRDIARRHQVVLIEDCAQAFGATLRGRWLGSFGLAGVYSFNVHKTITCGDGGMLVTSDESLYKRCFALHDQGHEPLRRTVEMVPNPWLGINLRMTELQGAVLTAQLRRLAGIRDRLLAARDLIGSMVVDTGVGLRELVDPDGDLATHLVLMFPDSTVAQRVASYLGSITLDMSGWHVYHRMTHLMHPLGTLPQTDALLARSMSFGLGVLDANLAPVGLTMDDSTKDMREKGAALRQAILRAME